MVIKQMKKPDVIKPLGKKPLRARILIFAHPGAGKSQLAGSTVEVGKTLILNADGPDGPESMRTAGYDPDVWDVADAKDLNEAKEFIRRGGWKEYDWVWLDSETLWEDSDMDAIMRDLVSPKGKGKTNRDVHLPDKPQYMLRQNHIGMWVREMCKLKINIGMTTHVMSIGIEEEDDDESTAQYIPAIQGSKGALSSKVCGHFGVVGRLYIRNSKVKTKGGDRKTVQRRVLQVQPSGKWYAKDRLSGGKLGSEIVNPTMKEIMAQIRRSK